MVYIKGELRVIADDTIVVPCLMVQYVYDS